MDLFNIFCTLLGGLGIFYYGMKSTSEVFQIESGDFIQKSMDSLSKNRPFIILTGTMLAALVQSSQAVILTTLGLINNGLIPLLTAMGITIGANLGTTLMGHILAIPMDKLSLLLVGISFIPTLFSNTHHVRQIGKMIFSVGLLFLGLQIMALGFTSIKENNLVIHSITFFSEAGSLKAILTLNIGILVTILLQSSLATLGIVMTMTTIGLIDLKLASLLILGLNIGATIPPLITSFSGDVNTKRVATGNFLFNFLTATPLFFIINSYPSFTHFFMPLTTKSSLSFSIALLHTLFNILQILFFAPFLDAYAKLLIRLIPRPKSGENENHEMFSNDNIEDVLPAMALYQIHKEIKNFRNIVFEMFQLTDSYINAQKLDAKTFYRIKDYEKKTDSIQKEISEFTRKLVQHRLGPTQSLNTQRAVLIATELENIADNLERIAVNKTRYHHTIPLEENILDEILVYSKEVLAFFEEVSSGIDSHQLKKDFSYYKQKGQELKVLADTIREDYLQSMQKDEYHPVRDRFFSDITMALRKIRAHTFNIAESLDQKWDDPSS